MIFREPSLKPGMRTVAGQRFYVDWFFFQLGARMITGAPYSHFEHRIRDLGEAVISIHATDGRPNA